MVGVCSTFNVVKTSNMKTLLIFSAMFFSMYLFPQDTIITRSGQMIPARVNEVTQTEIKYRKPSNPDGPLYVMYKSDVVVIEYKNGTRDVFSAAEHTNKESNASNSSQAQQAPTQNNYDGYTNPRSRVNIIVSPPAIGFGGYYPYYRPYPRFYGGWGYGYGGYCRPHYWRHW